MKKGKEYGKQLSFSYNETVKKNGLVSEIISWKVLSHCGLTSTIIC